MSAINQQQVPISVKAHIDTLGRQVHPRTGLLPMMDKEPKVIKILKAKQKQAAIVKASELTLKDSVRLNLIQLYPSRSEFFVDNTLTRLLHPVDTLTLSQIQPANLSVAVDSTTAVLPDSVRLSTDSVAQPVVSETLTTEASVVLKERNIVLTGMHREMGWLVPMVLFLIVFAGLVRSFSGKYIGNLFKGVFNQQNADNLYQMVNIRNSLPAYLLDLLFVLNLGLFSFLGLKIAGVSIGGVPSPLLYLIICGAVALIMMLKTSVYKFLGYVFGLGTPTNEFIFYVFLYTRTMSLVLLPFTVGLAFADDIVAFILLQSGLVLIVAMYLMQIFRGVKIFLRNLTAIFYMFLYLCALEILPVLVIIKFATR